MNVMLEGVRDQVNRLIALYEAQKQRADLLEKELLNSRQELDTRKKQITELNRQIDNLKLTGAFMGSGGSPAAKERINRLIGEIDKCIDILQK